MSWPPPPPGAQAWLGAIVEHAIASLDVGGEGPLPVHGLIGYLLACTTLSDERQREIGELTIYGRGRVANGPGEAL